MSDEEQERFADELDQYIEQLRLRKSARPPDDLRPQLNPIYGMATLFHATSSPVEDPRPEFSTQLYQRLRAQMQTADQEQTFIPSHTETAGLQENQRSTSSLDANHDIEAVGRGRGKAPVPLSLPSRDQKRVRSIYSNQQVSQPAPLSSISSEDTDVKKHKKGRMSRRALLTSGTIAASLVGGAVVGAAIDHSLEPPPPQQPTTDLYPHIKGATWYPVASVDQLRTDPIRFSTEAITGYVIRQAENSAEPIIAFSAACTHLGCIVQWKANTRQFPCPCHGRIFDVDGTPVYSGNSEVHYVSLPRLETKVENDRIYVKVPVL